MNLEQANDKHFPHNLVKKRCISKKELAFSIHRFWRRVVFSKTAYWFREILQSTNMLKLDRWLWCTICFHIKCTVHFYLIKYFYM